MRREGRREGREGREGRREKGERRGRGREEVSAFGTEKRRETGGEAAKMPT